MTYHIITTQPQIFESWLKTGLIARGIEKKIIDINVINLYDFGIGPHKKIDDTPYGGGAGMVVRVDVIANALAKLIRQNAKGKIILLTPQGKKFDQKIAKKLAKLDDIILISGRFEGYDERIRDLADEEISIGDYILTSGDLPAMVLIDAISRQIHGFIDRKESVEQESFSPLKIDNCKMQIALEYPQYTRPPVFTSRQARGKKNKKIPEVLTSGNHAKIADWRNDQAIKRTHKRRPDLTEEKI